MVTVTVNRMVDQVEDNAIILLVIVIGKREGDEVYLTADPHSGE